MGYFGKPGGGSDSDANRLGNLEVTPPCKVGNRDFPFGRIYYGKWNKNKQPNKELDEQTRKMLIAQHVQAPFEIDTSWLDLGHVDEMISFVPSNSPKNKWKACMPCPVLASALLHIAFIVNPTAPLFGGNRTVMVGNEMWTLPTTVQGFSEQKVIEEFRIEDSIKEAKIGLSKARKTFESEIGLADSDIISLPVLFGIGRKNLGGFLTANMVNMLVIGDSCIMAKPFGPRIERKALKKFFGTDAFHKSKIQLPPILAERLKSGIEQLPDEGEEVDLFELCATVQLEAEGLNVRFIDTWDIYHSQGGGLHCATNCKRVPSEPLKWWTFPN